MTSQIMRILYLYIFIFSVPNGVVTSCYELSNSNGLSIDNKSICIIEDWFLCKMVSNRKKSFVWNPKNSIKVYLIQRLIGDKHAIRLVVASFPDYSGLLATEGHCSHFVSSFGHQHLVLSSKPKLNLIHWH
jgi:hypothetical protein